MIELGFIAIELDHFLVYKRCVNLFSALNFSLYTHSNKVAACFVDKSFLTIKNIQIFYGKSLGPTFNSFD
jgi:hypothetical protein